MGNREAKIEILRKYLKDCIIKTPTYVGDEIPPDKLINAVKSYAKGADMSQVIGMIDESLFENGKAGILFTVNGVYCKHVSIGSKLIYFSYDEGIEFRRIANPLYKKDILNKMISELSAVE